MEHDNPLDNPRRDAESAYLRSSGARAVMRQAIPLLQDQGLPWRARHPDDFPGEAYWAAFEQDLAGLVATLGSGGSGRPAR